MIGAFTPTCSINHVPGYIQNLPQLKEKGVQVVAVIASNDPFVMSAWGKANNVKGDDIVSFEAPPLVLLLWFYRSLAHGILMIAFLD